MLDELRRVVNMSPKAREDWLKAEASQESGYKLYEGAESVGHDSGRRIVRLLLTRQAEYSDDDFAHMRKVVGYVHRHLAQQPQDDVKETPWRYSLMN